MELFCGGFTRQFVQNDGKCGLCGDPWDAPSPRPNEAGGLYANGILVRNYTKGQVLTARVQLTAHHKGHFEFRLCPVIEPDVEVTQECLDEHLLPLADGSGTKYYLPHGSGNGMFEVLLQLPYHLTCDRCVFQWIYSAGNNWGKCDDGTEAVGCGNQEQFRGCADIGISVVETPYPTEENGIFPELVPTERPKKKKKNNNKPHKKKKKPRPSQKRRKNKNKRSTTLPPPPPSSERPLLRGSGVLLTGLDPSPWEQNDHTWSEMSTITTAMPPVTHPRQLVQCIAVGPYAENPSITQWCMDNCLHTPPFCPPSHCKCHYINHEEDAQ